MRILPIYINSNHSNRNVPTSKGNYREICDSKDKLLYRTTTYFFRADLDWEAFFSLLKRKYKDVQKVNFINHCCSNGEEAYSCIVGLISYFGEDANKFFPIIAKDFDEENILKAKKHSPMDVTWDEISRCRDNTQTDIQMYFEIEKKESHDFVSKLFPKENLKKNVVFSQGDILKDIEEMADKNTVLMCRNFWPYLDKEKQEVLAQKLEKKFDESSLVVIGNFDNEDADVNKLLMEHNFLPTSVKNVFQKSDKIPWISSASCLTRKINIVKSNVVDTLERKFMIINDKNIL